MSANASVAKTCARCTRDKPLHLFDRDAKSADGHGSWCKFCKKHRHLENKYGIDGDAVAMQAETQGHRCLTCQRPAKGKLVVDHCHGTGRIRGLLCNNCNVALGMTRDDPVTLRRMIDYLL